MIPDRKNMIPDRKNMRLVEEDTRVLNGQTSSLTLVGAAINASTTTTLLTNGGPVSFRSLKLGSGWRTHFARISAAAASLVWSARAAVRRTGKLSVPQTRERLADPFRENFMILGTSPWEFGQNLIFS